MFVAKIRMNENVKEILEKYPEINEKDIMYCIPLYYPIGMIEVEMDEESFEDYDEIQIQILRLFALDICDVNMISRMLGLTSNYVSRLLTLLEGYGHIQDGRITSLGLRCLNEEHKIEYKTVFQKFQINALNGDFIKINEQICLNKLESGAQTNKNIIHMDYLDGVYRQNLISQINDKSYKQFILTRDDVNVNVRNVGLIKLLEIKYVLSYMFVMKDKGKFICSSRYDVKNNLNRFTWKPFSVSSLQLKNKYNIESDIPLMKESELNFVNKAYDFVETYWEELLNDQNMILNVQKKLESVYGIFPEKAYITDKLKIYAYFNQKDMKTFNSALYHLLLEYANKDSYIFWSDYLKGIPIYLFLQLDIFGIETLKLLKMKVDSTVKGKVKSYLMEHWDEDKYDNVFFFIRSCLDYMDLEKNQG